MDADDRLAEQVSPGLIAVVAINRAAAVAHARGPAEGLALLEAAAGGEARFEAFEPYWVAKADLSWSAGEREAARQAYTVAIGLETDPASRAFLVERLEGLEGRPGRPSWS